MKIPSYKFLPLMYQLAARMGTKMMGGLGFHEVLNNVSKPEKQNNSCFSFILSYTISSMYCCSILRNGNTKNFSPLLIVLRARTKISLCLLSLHIHYSVSLSYPHVPLSLTHTSPTAVSSTVTHISMLSKMKRVVDFLLFCLFA